MLPRPRPHRAFGAIRLSLTAFIAVHVFISAWLVVSIEGVYTEGKPAPTEAHSLVAIDKDRTMIDVEIKKATSFFFYTLERDGDAGVPAESSSSQTNDTSSDQGGESDEETDTEQGNEGEEDWLATGRQSITVTLVVLVLSELLMLSSFRWRHHVRTLALLFVVLAFSVVFPACYMLDLAGGDGAEEDNTATNTPGANIETVSFVHTNTSSNLSFTWLGLQLEADFSGYDLGLVEPENRSNVAERVPEEGSQDASSFIAFESTFDVELGKNLDSLLILPVMWYFLPAVGRSEPSKSYDRIEEE